MNMKFDILRFQFLRFDTKQNEVLRRTKLKWNFLNMKIFQISKIEISKKFIIDFLLKTWTVVFLRQNIEYICTVVFASILRNSKCSVLVSNWHFVQSLNFQLHPLSHCFPTLLRKRHRIGQDLPSGDY